MERDGHLSGNAPDGDEPLPSVHVEWDTNGVPTATAPSTSSLIGSEANSSKRRPALGLQSQKRNSMSQATRDAQAPLLEVDEVPAHTHQATRWAVGALLLLAALGLVAGLSSRTPLDEAASSTTTPSTVPTTEAVAQSAAAPTSTVPIIPAERAPIQWLAGRLIGFVDGAGDWRTIDLGGDQELATEGIYNFLIPPLHPDTVVVNLRNQSFAIDPFDPPNSGQLSNAVSLTRINSNTDRFGFVEHTPEGVARVTVSSLWAPTQGTVIEAPRDSTIIPVDRRGVVISQSNGDSFVVEDNAQVRVVPPTIGSIFAASFDLVIGRTCSDGRCVGVIADWEFMPLGTIELDPQTSDASVSPNGEWLASYLTTGAIEILSLQHAIEFPDSTVPRRQVRTIAQSELVWSTDSIALSWFGPDSFLATHVDEDALRIRELHSPATGFASGSAFFLSQPLEGVARGR